MSGYTFSFYPSNRSSVFVAFGQHFDKIDDDETIR